MLRSAPLHYTTLHSILLGWCAPKLYPSAPSIDPAVPLQRPPLLVVLTSEVPGRLVGSLTFCVLAYYTIYAVVTLPFKASQTKASPPKGSRSASRSRLSISISLVSGERYPARLTVWWVTSLKCFVFDVVCISNLCQEAFLYS